MYYLKLSVGSVSFCSGCLFFLFLSILLSMLLVFLWFVLFFFLFLFAFFIIIFFCFPFLFFFWRLSWHPKWPMFQKITQVIGDYLYTTPRVTDYLTH